MCGGAGILSSIVAPLAGLAFGGPLGAAIGLEGAAAPIVGGALAGGIGSELTGGKFLTGALEGGLGGYGGAPGAATQGAVSNAATNAFAGAADPIQGIYNAMSATGAQTATQAAQDLGYASTEAMVGAANPAWLSATGGISAGLAQGAMNMGMPSLANTISGGVPGGGGMIGAGGIPASIAPGAAAGGSSALGPISGGLQAVSGLYGLEQSKKLQQQAQQADPMAQYRAQYAQQLMQLQSNPSTLSSTPGYQAGLQAVQRSMAAQGYQGSGNMMAALQQYGGNAYNQQVQQLSQLAGVGISPGVSLQGQEMGLQSQASSLGLLAQGARSLGF